MGSTIPSAPLLPHDEVVSINEATRLLNPHFDDSKRLRSLYLWVFVHLTALSAFTALLVYM